jgi:hypothetical protein
MLEFIMYIPGNVVCSQGAPMADNSRKFPGDPAATRIACDAKNYCFVPRQVLSWGMHCIALHCVGTRKIIINAMNPHIDLRLKA